MIDLQCAIIDTWVSINVNLSAHRNCYAELNLRVWKIITQRTARYIIYVLTRGSCIKINKTQNKKMTSNVG